VAAVSTSAPKWPVISARERNPELAVGHAQVVLHRTGRHVQRGGGLAVGGVAGDESADVSLAGGEHCGVRRAPYTCVLAYKVGSSLDNYPLASVYISGLITTVLMAVIFLVVRRRDKRPAKAREAEGAG
jgi:hypothetical protein